MTQSKVKHAHQYDVPFVELARIAHEGLKGRWKDHVATLLVLQLASIERHEHLATLQEHTNTLLERVRDASDFGNRHG